MAARMVLIFIFVLALFASGRPPLSVALLAQDSCTQEISRQDEALRQFDADVRRESLTFAIDDAGRTALNDIRSKLAGDPTADAAEEMKKRWDEYQEFLNRGKTFLTILEEVGRCVQSGMKGCLNELIEKNREGDLLLGRVNDAMNKWIESLGNESISNAAARVERARGIIEGFMNRAGNLATGAMSGAMQNCFRDFDRRVQQAQNDSVDLRQPSPPRQDGGTKAQGKKPNPALVAATVGGGLLGGYFISKQITKAIENAGAAGSGTAKSGCDSSRAPISEINRYCFGSTRNTSLCNQYTAQYDSFCKSCGFSRFDVNVGGCR